ncbi:RNA polymerase sigma factor [Chitinophaga skermanii]|uniref:RNA polymerase sigma factor n=1 Tax=Chitinophaga skermanii TaxID=331697 RepID=UPI001FEC03D9|nr:sigma-70 family RNA polymerase sigma factor [Chitinophaga skermanii]
MNIEKDQELLQGLAANNDKALEIIYKENFPMVLRMILLNNGSEDDAKDIFQEAIIVLYEKVQEGDFILSSKLTTFLYSVCRRLWLKKLQGGSHLYPMNDTLEEIVPVEDTLDQHEEKDQQFIMMEQAMQHIGEPCKTILEDYYLQKKNMQEIAEKFGYTNAENAKNQKYKCLVRLKKLFFAQYK